MKENDKVSTLHLLFCSVQRLCAFKRKRVGFKILEAYRDFRLKAYSSTSLFLGASKLCYYLTLTFSSLGWSAWGRLVENRTKLNTVFSFFTRAIFAALINQTTTSTPSMQRENKNEITTSIMIHIHTISDLSWTADANN